MDTKVYLYVMHTESKMGNLLTATTANIKYTSTLRLTYNFTLKVF